MLTVEPTIDHIYIAENKETTIPMSAGSCQEISKGPFTPGPARHGHGVKAATRGAVPCRAVPCRIRCEWTLSVRVFVVMTSQQRS